MFKRRWRTSAILQQLFEGLSGLVAPRAIVYAAGCSKATVIVDAVDVPSLLQRPRTANSTASETNKPQIQALTESDGLVRSSVLSSQNIDVDGSRRGRSQDSTVDVQHRSSEALG